MTKFGWLTSILRTPTSRAALNTAVISLGAMCPLARIASVLLDCLEDPQNLRLDRTA